MRHQEDTLVILHNVAKCTLKKIRFATDDAVGRLEDNLHRTELISAPSLADVTAVRAVRWLVAHGEGPDSDPKLFVQRNIEAHAFKQVSRRIMEVVEHIVGKL